MQEVKEFPTGDADIQEHGNQFRLVNFRVAVDDFVDLRSDADLPLVLHLHLIVLHVLHAESGDVVVGRLAHHQHDAIHVAASCAPHVPHGLLHEHLDCNLF